MKEIMDTLYYILNNLALKICNNSLRHNILSKLRCMKESKKKKVKKTGTKRLHSKAERLLCSLISPELLSACFPNGILKEEKSKYKIETHELSKTALVKVRPKKQQKAAEQQLKIDAFSPDALQCILKAFADRSVYVTVSLSSITVFIR